MLLAKVITPIVLASMEAPPRLAFFLPRPDGPVIAELKQRLKSDVKSKPKKQNTCESISSTPVGSVSWF